ncbi:MAG: adenylate kinase [Nannocystaceae bacterium]
MGPQLPGNRTAQFLGTRIHIMGNTCAGKSTLAERLASRWKLPPIDLDALNWLPKWVGLTQTDPNEFERRLRSATAGDDWVVAGSYSEFCQRVFSPRLQTVIWLDMPLARIVARVLTRAWRRQRSGELLWGTNTERMWPHLKVWHEDSLVRWAVTQHRRKQRWMLAQIFDPMWAHIRFIRLRSPAEVDALVAGAAPNSRAP